MPEVSAALWGRMEVKNCRSCETRWYKYLPLTVRVTAALIRVFGDVSYTRKDCCGIAAAVVAPLALREGLLCIARFLPPVHKQQPATSTCVASPTTPKK